MRIHPIFLLGLLALLAIAMYLAFQSCPTVTP